MAASEYGGIRYAGDGMDVSGEAPVDCAVRDVIAANIRLWRKCSDTPLKCLADEVGVSIAVCSQWANGKRFPSPEHLQTLAKLFGCGIWCLLCPRYDPEKCKLLFKNEFAQS